MTELDTDIAVDQTPLDICGELIDHLGIPESSMVLFRERFDGQLLSNDKDERFAASILAWVMDFIREHNKAPSTEAVHLQFGNEWSFQQPKETVKYLIAKYRERYRRQEVQTLIKVLARTVNTDPDLAAEEGSAGFQRLQAVTSSRQSRLSTADWRGWLNDYETGVAEGRLHGITFGFKDIDHVLGGLRKDGLYYVIGRPKRFKAQPLDAKVLTPTGWRLMGDIALGDAVLNPYGGVSRVVGVHPQGMRDAYRVDFSDDSSVECDLEHLWPTRTKTNRPWKVRTLRECMDRLDSDGDCRVYTPTVTRLDFDLVSSLPLDPYAMGLLIGDGGFRGRSPDFTTDDIYSYEKFIPEVYKTASHEQRHALLQGLMDTDGCCFESGQTSFVTSSRRLAEDVQEIVRSLGGTTQINLMREVNEYRNSSGEMRPCQPGYVMRIAISSNPFRLQRKADRWHRVRSISRRMVAVTRLDPKEMQCITLDSDNQLYVTDDYVVTHNSWLLMKSAVEAQEQGHRIAFFSLELTEKEMYGRYLAMKTGLPWNHMQHGGLLPRQIDDAKKVMESMENVGHFECIHSPVEQCTVPELVRQAREIEADVVYIDQLKFVKSTQKVSADMRHREVEYVNEDLKRAAENFPIYVAAQYNREAAGMTEMADLAKIGLSDSIGQTADMLFGLYANRDMMANNQIEFGTIESRSFEQAKWLLKVTLTQNSNFEVVSTA